MKPNALSHPNARLYQRASNALSTFSKTFPHLKLKSSFINSFANETNDFYLFLNNHLFVACWCLIWALHASDCAFLMAMTMLYDWLLHDDLARYNLLDGLMFELSYPTLGVLIWCFAVVAGLQALAMLRMLVRSAQSGKLTMAQVYRRSSTSTMFSSALVATNTDPATQPSDEGLLEPQVSGHPPPLQPPLAPQEENSSSLKVHAKSPKAWLASIRHQFVKKWIAPAFYINGRYFDDFFILQACLQAGFQIYQANRMSLFIATRWINNVMVAMIFLNCVSTPLVHWLVPLRNAPLRRLLELTISALLSFTSSVVLPLVIFIKYIRSYDPATHYFDLHHVFNDVWWAKAVRENQLLFVTSPLVFVSTLWSHYNLLTSLMICQSIVHSNDDFRKVAVSLEYATTTFITNEDGSRTAVVLKSPLRRVSQFSRTSTCSNLRKPSPKSKVRVLVRLVLQFVLCVCGAFVLMMHGFALQAPQVEGCMLATKPWFHAGQSSCAVMNVNCHRLGIQGLTSQIASVLSPLNHKTLVSLIFTHCPQLEIPPSIRMFHTLDGIEIYNSSLRQWPADSSPRSEDFPAMTSIYLVRSNVHGEIPEGLVQDSFPTSLQQIFFVQTNLTTLPADLHLKWPSVSWLMLAFANLSTIPPVVHRMDLESLDFTGNPLESVDLDLFANDHLNSLTLSASSLTSLPATTNGNLSQLKQLYLEHTALQSVPDYIQHWYMDHWPVDHSLFGSPYCNKSVASVQERAYQQRVCSKDLGTYRGNYPVEYVASQRLP